MIQIMWQFNNNKRTESHIELCIYLTMDFAYETKSFVDYFDYTVRPESFIVTYYFIFCNNIQSNYTNAVPGSVFCRHRDSIIKKILQLDKQT